MQRLKVKSILVFLVLFITVACDPMAPDAPQVVIILTATPTRTPLPTRTPVPTQTPTPVPPTETPTATPWVCEQQSGQVIDLAFDSKITRGSVPYRAYLPPCYADTARRYPYVILMHGSDSDETEWTDLIGTQRALEAGLSVQALPPMILIMPDGGELANTNTFRNNGSWEYVVINELIPEVEKNFCSWNAREGRAIGGISRGGFWAFEIGFRHPELFGAIGGHSAFFDPQHAPPDYNPMSLASSIEFNPGEQPRIWLDAGKDDYARFNIEMLQKTLASRNIDPNYTMNPVGSHEVKYWAAHVAEYLSFYGETWPRNIDDLPSCLS